MSTGSSISVADGKRKRSSLVLLLRMPHDEAMTLSDCPVCGRRELRGTRSLHTVATRRGDVLATTCRGCGAELSAASSLLLRLPARSTVPAVA